MRCLDRGTEKADNFDNACQPSASVGTGSCKRITSPCLLKGRQSTRQKMNCHGWHSIDAQKQPARSLALFQRLCSMCSWSDRDYCRYLRRCKVFQLLQTSGVLESKAGSCITFMHQSMEQQRRATAALGIYINHCMILRSSASVGRFHLGSG